MMQPPDPTSYSNLPASFDVTPLLTQLQQHLDLEEEQDATIKNSNNVSISSAIQRVQLIELDPYYHHPYGKVVEPRHRHQQHKQLPPPARTRLLLAVAYGKKIVVSQLIALELGRVARDDSGTLTNESDDVTANTADGEAMDDVEEDNDCDDMEWIDASSTRVQYPTQNGDYNRNDKDEGRERHVFVIFPISSNMENHLSLDGCALTMNNGGCSTGDITSCALIPAPTVGDAQRSGSVLSSTTNVATHHPQHPRTVALMLGTACDQVLSVQLNVSVKSCSSSSSSSNNDPKTTTSTSVLANDNINNDNIDNYDDGVRFALEYAECKIIQDGKLRERAGTKREKEDVNVMNPIFVQQILPYAKIFDGNNDVDLRERAQLATAMDDDYDDDHDNNIHTTPIHVFKPTIAMETFSSPDMTPSYDRDRMVLGGSATSHSGVKSITYSRRRTSNAFVAGEIIGEDVREDQITNQDLIWISYGSGTIVRLPSWRPFFAFWKSSAIDINDDGVINRDIAWNNGSSSSVVVPLGINFPSPLDIPPPRINQCKRPISSYDETESRTHDCDDYWNRLYQIVLIRQESERRNPNPQLASARAMILPVQSAAPLASMQSIAFLSSRVKCDPSSTITKDRVIDSASGHVSFSKSGKQGHHPADDDHCFDGEYGPVTGKVVGGTAALVKGAFGMALGAVRWGLSGKVGIGVTAQNLDDDDENGPLDEFLEADDDSKNIMFDFEHSQNIARRGREKDLVPWPMSCASFAFSDLPRRFESAVIDPSGSLVATTDNLGRVTLFDLETNQPIRMFKGMRNVSCYFAEMVYTDNINDNITKGSARLYLIIHFRKRGIVDIYRLNQGPRVSSIMMPQQKDCEIITCLGPPSEGCRVSNFLLERIHGLNENRTGENHYVVDKLVIDDSDAVSNTSSQKPSNSTHQNESKMHLRLLMQLLAPETNIKCTAQTVLVTFKSIHTLSDLGEALDALSKSTRLESDSGIDGSNLLSQAITYCTSRLEHAMEIEAKEGSGTVRKAAIEEMSSKLAYFNRLVQAYNVLNRYETRNGLSNNEIDDEVRMNENISSWASEALYWISTTSSIDTLRIKGSAVFDAGNDTPMEFSMFSLSCQPRGNDRVYFTKVKRDRLPIITRIFRPLLQDLFVFKVVNSVTGSLGLDHDFVILQQYFGEWVCSLPTDVIARSNMTGAWRPMIRWLHELILRAHDVGLQGQQTLDNNILKTTARLDTLLIFCMDMEDLPKAFLLAVICMDAVSSASIQLEQKTYGEISQREAVTPWEDLLRKLRVCLLISVRLEGNVSRMGEASHMTVNNVSRPDLFSVFSWIALDELSLSHDNQVLLALESACLSNPEAFYPTTVDSDRENNRKTIIQSCSSPLHGRRLDDSRTQPLLFYLKDHAHFTTRLAANRALVLASMWGQSPANMTLLSNAISTLRTVVGHVEGFSLATLVDIYQMQLRPVCRAILFGFGEHELSNDVLSSLIEDKTWLGELTSAVKHILSMMVECMPKMPAVRSANFSNSSEMWPPTRECPLLSSLVLKYPTVQLSSVELHHTVIFAYEMTRSVSSLETAVPSLPNLFLAGSIFTSMPRMLKGSVGHHDLLDKAIRTHAENSQRPVFDNFSCLNSVELFGKSLGLDSEYVRSRFLIEMIRLGKDASILDLLGSSISSSENKYFSEAVAQIISVRLHSTILSLKQTKKYRGLLSLLDADATRWLREEASHCSSSDVAPASLVTTNSLAVRVKRTFGNTADESLSKKISTLCLMSETLLKAVQSLERETVMTL